SRYASYRLLQVRGFGRQLSGKFLPHPCDNRLALKSRRLPVPVVQTAVGSARAEIAHGFHRLECHTGRLFRFSENEIGTSQSDEVESVVALLVVRAQFQGLRDVGGRSLGVLVALGQIILALSQVTVPSSHHSSEFGMVKVAHPCGQITLRCPCEEVFGLYYGALESIGPPHPGIRPSFQCA